MKRFCTSLFILVIVKQTNTQENLSKRSDVQASQSSTYTTGGYYPANLAIEGGPTHDFYALPKSCTATGGRKRVAWWMLSFTGQVYISNVVIYYRDTTLGRLAGYSLYVSNSTISTNPPQDAYLCFNHTENTLPHKVQNVTCDQLGEYVIIYNERKSGVTYPEAYSSDALLELCDVQVMGCPRNYSGPVCSIQCPDYCIDRHCDPSNRACIWGCSWETCLNGLCRPSDGTCEDGCIQGKAGLFCTKNNIITSAVTLPDVGNKDDFLFDGDKTGRSCITIQGTSAFAEVDTGQKHAFRSITITFRESVNASHYSLYITNSSGETSKPINISDYLLDELSYPFHFHNYTFNTIIVGQYVQLRIISAGNIAIDVCEVEVLGCEYGFYGPHCNISCPPNCAGQCDLETGRCVSGCKDGYINTFCDQACTPPSFGYLCTNTCHCFNTQEECNFINGTCPAGGCQLGWEGSSCSKVCDAGRFGYNCNESCSGCLEDKCSPDLGLCLNNTGCKPGFVQTNPKCNKTCENGYFGDCKIQCHCLNGFCDKSTGKCPNGICQQGWMSDSCSKECMEGTFGYNCVDRCDRCSNSSCDRFDGNCTYGCIEGYEGHQCQISLQVTGTKEENKNTNSLAGIGGGIGGTLAVLIAVVVVVITIRRKKESKMKKTPSVDSLNKLESPEVAVADNTERTNVYYNVANLSPPLLDDQIKSNQSLKTKDVSMSSILAITDEAGDIYTNTEIKHEIRIKDLQQVIQENSKDEGFKLEYENLPKGLLMPHIEGSKEENKVKNRFLTTWPYDHSRVILTDNDDSDYINANYIDNYSKKKAYIATQASNAMELYLGHCFFVMRDQMNKYKIPDAGPKQGTVKDFWQMVWQEDVEVIVMVTNLEEKGKKKCFQYWPDAQNKGLTASCYQIVLEKEYEVKEYTHRQLKLHNKENKEKRTIHQFHFLEWPDHGVPNTISLVHFYRKVKHIKRNLDGPMVVHCSAGIGRTGTFIAIDALYERGLKTGSIDLREYVDIMRKDRMNMIQTKEQYETVYEALLEAFTVPDCSFDINEFMDKQMSACHQTIQDEFKNLMKLRPNYSDECFRIAKTQENIDKNVNLQILPHDTIRPYLMSYESKRNDYINAVSIPNIYEFSNILVTQLPLQATVVDFWTMIYDQDCYSIVLLEDAQREIDFVPQEGQDLNFKIFDVQRINDESVSITHKKNKESREVRLLRVEDWPSQDTKLPDEKLMIELYEKSKTDKSLAVVCRDGCSRCGIFAALYIAFKGLNIDNEVDVFHIVRMMQISRPEFIQTIAEYEYLYTCVRRFAEMDSLYANV